MKVLTYTPSAARTLSRLPKPARTAIVEKLGRYAATGAGDVRALMGRPGARLRVGDYRVVFIETDEAIQVLALGHRRDIYE